MQATVMMVGLGGLGFSTLELLAGAPEIERIVVASRNAEYGTAVCNLINLGAVARHANTRTDFTPLDLNRPEEAAETIRRHSPDLIFHTATMQSPLAAFNLPPAAARPIQKAGFGVWLPVHLNLSLKLMRILRQADFKGRTVMAPYPDVVNCILGCLDMPPTCGIGNVDLLVPKIRLLAARKLSVPPESVGVQLVGHHALAHHVVITVNLPDADASCPPFHLTVEHDLRDVTAAVDAPALLLSPFSTPMGLESNHTTAVSALGIIRALLSETKSALHAPGPHGLPGGYPVTANCHGIEMEPLRGLSADDAVEINRASTPFEGIRQIEADGTAVFMPETVAIMRDTLGYDCHRLCPDEAEERGRELIQRFQEYVHREGSVQSV